MNSGDFLGEHFKIQKNIADTLVEINRLTHSDYKADLLRIHSITYKKWSALDNEMVNCRRRGALTHKYSAMQSDIERNLKYIQKHISWALLSQSY